MIQQEISEPPSLHPVDTASPAGGLQSRNVRIHSHRTSVRLEPEMWSALNDIAELENCSVNELCSVVHDLKDPGVSFTAALRVFMVEYYRSAARRTHQITKVQMQLRATRNRR